MFLLIPDELTVVLIVCLIVCIAQRIEVILEYMTGNQRIHGSFPHADTVRMGTKCPLVISIVGGNIHSEEDLKKKP